jgi:hypothetical protein
VRVYSPKGVYRKTESPLVAFLFVLCPYRPAQDAQLTTSELLALAAEEDGSSLGQQKQEEKRQKEEKWARYTDEHKKGEGNTMNRG